MQCKSNATSMLGFQLQAFLDSLDNQLFQDSFENTTAIDAMRVLRVHRRDISNDFIELFQRELDKPPLHVDQSLLSRRLQLLDLNASAFAAATMSAHFAQVLNTANMGPHYQQQLLHHFTQQFIAATLPLIVQSLNQLLALSGVLPLSSPFSNNDAAND